MDTPLHSDFIPRFERNGGGSGGVCIPQDLDVGEPDPVGGSFTLPHTLNVEVVQTIVVQLAADGGGRRGRRGGEKETLDCKCVPSLLGYH